MTRALRIAELWTRRNFGKILIAALVVGSALAYNAHSVDTTSMHTSAARG